MVSSAVYTPTVKAEKAVMTSETSPFTAFLQTICRVYESCRKKAASPVGRYLEDLYAANEDPMVMRILYKPFIAVVVTDASYLSDGHSFDVQLEGAVIAGSPVGQPASSSKCTMFRIFTVRVFFKRCRCPRAFSLRLKAVCRASLLNSRFRYKHQLQVKRREGIQAVCSDNA